MKFKTIACILVFSLSAFVGIFADTQDDILNHQELNTVTFQDKTFYKINSIARSKTGVLRFGDGYNPVDIFANEDFDGVLIYSDRKVFIYLSYEEIKTTIDKFNNWYKEAKEKGWFNADINTTNKSFDKELYCFKKTIGYYKKYKRSEGGGRKLIYPKVDFHFIFSIFNYQCSFKVNIIDTEAEKTIKASEFSVTDMKIFEYILKNNKELAKEAKQNIEAQKNKELDMESCFN